MAKTVYRKGQGFSSAPKVPETPPHKPSTERRPTGTVSRPAAPAPKAPVRPAAKPAARPIEGPPTRTKAAPTKAHARTAAPAVRKPPARSAAPAVHKPPARSAVPGKKAVSSPARRVEQVQYTPRTVAALDPARQSASGRNGKRRRKKRSHLPQIIMFSVLAFISLLVGLILLHDYLLQKQPADAVQEGGFFSEPILIDFEAAEFVWQTPAEEPPTEPELIVSDVTSLAAPILSAQEDDLSQWPALQEKVFQCDDVCFFAVDVATGQTICYQPDKVLYLASAIKAPYALYAFREMDAGVQSLDTEVIYTEDLYDDGTGEIKNDDFDTVYTLGYAIQESLHCSDNIGYRMAVRQVGRDGFNRMLDELELPEHTHFTATNIWPSASPREMALLWSAIMDYTESDAEHAGVLKNDLLSSRYSAIRSALNFRRTVASKHGWQDEFFHDCGIVYDAGGAPQYVIALLTGNGNNEQWDLYNMTYPVIKELINVMDARREEAAAAG